ncbi:MAG: ribosome biogenesis GTPase Der [Bradymonadales bacterium]|nr:MAG: ribosome biogenesis GTPase Der [Bradymonadales bacterium]
MIVALLGRPNVGKSSLFNRLIGRRRALVWDQEGVTRDRLVETLNLSDTESMELWDLAGYQTEADFKKFPQAWTKKINLYLWIVDGSEAFSARDELIRDFLRKQEKPVLVWLNKSDKREFNEEISQHLAKISGFEWLEGAAETGRGLGELKDNLIQRIRREGKTPKKTKASADTTDSANRVFILGRPNVGKSSLINRLSGQRVSEVADQPGTTRDSVEQRIRFEGQNWVFVDTAGIRKKPKIYKTEDPLEIFSSQLVLKQMNRADLVLLLVEAHTAARLSTQDRKLFQLLQKASRPTLIVVNKWDLIRDTRNAKAYRRELLDSMGLSDHYRVVFVSARTGFGIKNLERVCRALVESRRRITTPELNRWLKNIQAKRSPRMIRKGMKKTGGKTQNRYLRFNYMLQTSERPMRFQIFTNAPSAVPKDEKKYLENRLREDFDLGPLPIQLLFRAKN